MKIMGQQVPIYDLPKAQPVRIACPHGHEITEDQPVKPERRKTKRIYRQGQYGLLAKDFK